MGRSRQRTGFIEKTRRSGQTVEMMKRDVDTIIELIRAEYPGVAAKQLEVRFPGRDDDGLWFFTHPGTNFEVQIESPNGMCPFLIETDELNDRKEGQSVGEVADILKNWLHLV